MTKLIDHPGPPILLDEHGLLTTRHGRPGLLQVIRDAHVGVFLEPTGRDEQPMIVGDVTTAGLHEALRGLDARRAAHENNIANVETPGYKARSIQFESALRGALAAGEPRGAGHTVQVSNAFGRANGNNVNVDQEMVGLTETALTQQLVIRALNDKYGLIRDAIGGV